MKLKEAHEQLQKAQKLYNQISELTAKEIRAAEDKIYNRKREEDSSCASDYAGFSSGDYSFYYGYEELAPHPLLADEKDKDDRETWAFVVTLKGKEIYRKAIIPEHVDWGCNRGLIAGIGYYLESKTINKD